MKIAQYVETFSYVGMFNTMNFASYICLYLISPFMQHPVCYVGLMVVMLDDYLYFHGDILPFGTSENPLLCKQF